MLSATTAAARRLRCLYQLADIASDARDAWAWRTPRAASGDGSHKTGLDEMTDDHIQEIAMTLTLALRKGLGVRSRLEASLGKPGKQIHIHSHDHIPRRA